MTTELKVSKGPLGEYLHLNIPEEDNSINDKTNYSIVDFFDRKRIHGLYLRNDIIGEPNRVMGDVCDDYDNYNELDWII